MYAIRSYYADGDGSRASPFGTLGRALAVATDGALVVMAKGIYRESIRTDGNVSLRGPGRSARPPRKVMQNNPSITE